MGRKYWVKRNNCLLGATSHFPTVFFLTLSQTSPGLCVCSTSLLKTQWEKAGKGEIARITSNFSFSHSVFYHFHKIYNCRVQTRSVWKSLKFVVWERVKKNVLQTCKNTGLFRRGLSCEGMIELMYEQLSGKSLSEFSKSIDSDQFWQRWTVFWTKTVKKR